jgi:hypothetical protein
VNRPLLIPDYRLAVRPRYQARHGLDARRRDEPAVVPCVRAVSTLGERTNAGERQDEHGGSRTERSSQTGQQRSLRLAACRLAPHDQPVLEFVDEADPRLRAAGA